jgi:hypothetical protein
VFYHNKTIEGDDSMEFGEGTEGPKFRSPVKWSINNRMLMGLLVAHDIKLSELAEYLNVSPRTVQRLVYESRPDGYRQPNKENMKTLCELLGVPKNILFGEVVYEKVSI